MSSHIYTAAAARLLERDIRLAYFDIDGTLLGRDGRYTQRLQQAIAAAQQRGIKTAVASGRPRFAADFLVQQLGLKHAGLFYAGALLYDPLSATRLALHALADELADALLSEAERLGLYTEICSEQNFYVEALTPLGKSHSEHLRVEPQVCRLRDAIGRDPVVKMLFAVQRYDQHERLYQLEKDFPQTNFSYACMASQPEWLFASVTSTDACKQRGFNELLRWHDVSAEQVIAFGDAQSDMTFISMAGVGVAMGNASEAVKAVADIETTAVWEDGVAVVLEQVVGA